MIAAQLDDARARFTAIGPGRMAIARTASHPAPHSGHPDACHRGNETSRDGRRGRPPRGGGCAGVASSWASGSR